MLHGLSLFNGEEGQRLNFDKLNKMIPYVVGGKEKVLSMHPYNAITLAMPGRHAQQTQPLGGDFVVMVDDSDLDWTSHQFTHTDLFNDLQTKVDKWPQEAERLMLNYYKVITGADPERLDAGERYRLWAGTLHPQTFLYAVQALAVAEHRRYAKHEKNFGGRFLPFRFAAGIVEGNWNAALAAERQRRGRIGVEWLEKQYGTPSLTETLISAN